ILCVTQHTDKTLIVNAYTEKYGRIAYALLLGRGKSGRVQRALLTPFSVLSIECDYRQKEQIHRIRGIECLAVQQLQFDPVKGAVTLFLSDFLMHVIREPEPYPSFFKFLTDSIALYNVMQVGKANFHLCFLFHLSYFLGFYPDIRSYRDGAYFDLVNGVYSMSAPEHLHVLMPEDAKRFVVLSRMNFCNLHLFSFSRDERRLILDRIIEYYGIHQGFAPLKSTEILRILFD
ncbi:MAG: DNA repair protein RecO C-terminal domain-containing protein, partial [Bacteroidales bacterium]